MRSVRVLLVVALLAWGADAQVRPAAGGVRLLPALESAPLAVVGTFEAPRALDGEAWVAGVQVEGVLVGELARGERVSVAWEELARQRPVRFREGDRALLALERLSGSIWRTRLPEPETRFATWAIAEGGDAFARSPSPGAVQLVQHFLALPPELRNGNPGVSHLIALAQSAEPVLAAAALERLGEVPGLDAEIGERSAERLVRTLLREPELSRAALELVEARRLESLRPLLEARATPDGTGPAPVYEALGRLDGSLPPEVATALLAREDSADHRAVGARHAARAASAQLPALLRRDGSPAVRAAAVERLVELHGVSEIDRVLYALEDPDAGVRGRAVAALAGLGDEAVPALREVVAYGSPEAARTAVTALRASGSEGVRALREIAASHPDESVRTLARVALGGSIGHRHE